VRDGTVIVKRPDGRQALAKALDRGAQRPSPTT